MTILIIDGTEKHDIVTHEGQTVLDVMLAAQDKYWSEDTSIDKLLVNGDAIEPLNETTLASIPADGTRIEINLKADVPRSLNETLGEAGAYLARLESGFEELSNNIRNNNDSAQYTHLHDGMEGLSQIITLFSTISDNDAVSEELSASFKELVKNLNDKSEELTDAQESKDPTLIADILEYEFIESIQELRSYLDQLKEKLTD